MAESVDLAARAVSRGLELLRVLNEEHTTEELHRRARAVRHELETAQELLSRFGTDIVAPRDGKSANEAPATSAAAARAIRTQSGSQRHRILRELKLSDESCMYGMTDFELQASLRMGASSERPRRLELVEAGFVVAATDPNGVARTRKAPWSSLLCQVWQITPKGRAALAKLNAGQMVLVEVP